MKVKITLSEKTIEQLRELCHLDYLVSFYDKKREMSFEELRALANSQNIPPLCVEYNKAMEIINIFDKSQMTEEEWNEIADNNDKIIENNISTELNKKVFKILNLPVK